MKILVFMSDNRKLTNILQDAEYHSLAVSINYEYCKKHGHDFIYYRPYLFEDRIYLNNNIDPNTKKPRHSAWSKLLSTSLALKLEYDYIVYIDSDCIFKGFNMRLEIFIEPYSKNDVIFLNNLPWKIDKPCSGFYICKVSLDVIDFIKIWYSYDFKDNKYPFKYNINPCKFEQGALWNIYTQYNIALVNSIMFLEREDQFLRHIGTNDKHNRIPYFSKFINDNNIDFSKNISEIKTIEYSTLNIDNIEYSTLNIDNIDGIKCSTINCLYKIHTNPSNNDGSHCCQTCKHNGYHGPYCERLE